MDVGLRKKPEPFHSFTAALKILVISGYWKLDEQRNKYIRIGHEIYRILVIFLVYIYTAQHGIYIWVVRDDTEKLLEAVILELPEMILCCKVTVLYFQTTRLDKITELIRDPIFAPKNKKDEENIHNNNVAMTKLIKIMVIGISCASVSWILLPIAKRYQDETTNVPSYIPFQTDTWPRFILANFIDTCPILWIGYGHLAIDCLIATYFAQAEVQLKVIKYNLEHLFDSENGGKTRISRFRYLDEIDHTTQERFVHYVNRYERVIWYVNEVTSIFGLAMSLQFFLTSCTTCLVVYQMSYTSTLTMDFNFLLGYYLSTQFQIFVYCYYGGLVEYESKFVSDSVYLSEWLSLSPRFRRQLSIAMCRWIKPITPRVSTIVPLSLPTFISLSRSAYTLYTVLKSSNSKENGQKTLAF